MRTSYGILGNQNTTDYYPTYVQMPTSTGTGDWLLDDARTNTSSAPGLVSQSLTWERIKTWNTGVDLSLFDGQLTSTIDYFIRKTNQMVGPAPQLPNTLGTDVPNANNTNLKTNGWEFSLGWRDNLPNGVTYSVKALVWDYKSEVTKYPNTTGSLDTYVQDQMLGAIWGYETVGIARSQAEMDDHLASLTDGAQSALGSQWAAGDIMYKDLNGDGKINNGSNTTGDPGDLKVIGNSTPRYLFSLDLNASWKGFDIRAFFQGVGKRDYFNNSYYFWGAYDWGIWWSTGFTEHKDYFRADESSPLGQNLNSYYPRPLFNGKNHQVQTKYLQNAAYIRLKNFQVGYTIPASVLKKVKIGNVRIFFSGENLWTLTSLSSIFDPETIDGGVDNNSVVSGSVYPLSKVYSTGVSINF